MARKPAPDTRERMLDVAAQLFYERGVNAVGLQQIIDEFGCGKNLLYREFPSKDDLVVAWLERCMAEWEAKVDEITGPLADEPAEALIALVRATADDSACPGYRGCALRNTHAEFPDPEHPAHRVSVDYVNQVRSRLLDLAERAGARDPQALADRIMLITDGLVLNSAVLGCDGAAAEAVTFAEEVVRAAVPAKPRRLARTRTGAAPRRSSKAASSGRRARS